VIALIQRVAEAAVTVDGEVVGAIGPGVLALIGVERSDDDAQAARLAERVLSYRVFADGDGRMNLSLLDVNGALLAVPQFTLAADTEKGNRASLSGAASPEVGARLFNRFVELAGQKIRVSTGRFGAHMKVSLVNDGPVTFWLQVRPLG